MAGHGGDPKKVVKAAMLANGGIAIAKFVAAFLSDSTTMLAEGVHSIADTANQGLLLVGIVLSSRRADERFPMGRASESYFWSFIVALMLFFLGGVFAIYEGVHKLQHASHPGSPWAPIVVLVLSIALEGGSFLVALREFQKVRGNKSYREALFDGKDPVIPVVLLEDAGAMAGLFIALVAVAVTAITGHDLADGVGSIVIGVLLCLIGILLAKDTRSLLIGEGVSREVKLDTVAIVEATPGVRKVRQLLSLHLGPDTVLLALKVEFDASLDLKDIERTIDQIEHNVREKHPMMRRIFIEADSDYDATKDKAAPEALA
jgi:cation diffusion facilitator family transporter